MKRTLFTRVFPLYLGAVALGLLALTIVTTVQLSQTLRDRTQAELHAIADHLIAPDSGNAVEALLALLSDSPFVDAIGIVDNRGDGVVGSEPSGPYFTAIPHIRDITSSPPGAPGYWTATTRNDETGRWFTWAAVPIARDRFILLARATAQIGAQAGPAIGAVGLVTALLVAAIATLLYRILKWIDDPIHAIQESARYLAEGRLDVAVRTTGPPELQELAADLNHMAGQLRRRIAAISTQRNQLEAILTSMLEGVVVLDPSRQILSMNEAGGRLLDVDASEAPGRTLIEFLRNAQLDELAETAFSSGSSIERTITVYRDRPLHLQVHSTPLVAEGNERIGSLMVINDITRLVQLETLRRDFVANVSHELKTPITSIQGFVETLVDGPLDNTDETRRYLQIITKHTNRLNAIIEDLLSLSRLEHSDQSITFRQFSLSDLQAAVDNTVRTKAARKQIDLSWKRDGSDDAWGNPNLLEQALVNLIDNAIKYSPESSPVVAELDNDRERLILRVSDHGQGIPARDLPRVFERFYRTDKARSRELGGTGLGLAIVKHIARAHRGTVSASSIYGEGSTFTVEIPQNRTESSASQGLEDVR